VHLCLPPISATICCCLLCICACPHPLQGSVAVCCAFALPQSSATIRRCLTCVCAATILCDNLLLSRLPELFISFPCTTGIPAMLFLHCLAFAPSHAFATIAPSGAYQTCAVARLFQPRPIQHFAKASHCWVLIITSLRCCALQSSPALHSCTIALKLHHCAVERSSFIAPLSTQASSRRHALSFIVALSSALLFCWAQLLLRCCVLTSLLRLCALLSSSLPSRTHQFFAATRLAYHLIAAYGPIHLICIVCTNLIFALLFLLAIYQAQVWLIHHQDRINFCYGLSSLHFALALLPGMGTF
jgi:hypothetical protein